MTDTIIILRHTLIELNIKKEKINTQINDINNQIKIMAEEYVKTNHLNITTPIEYIQLYSIETIENHIKDLYGKNVIWGATPISNLLTKLNLTFDRTTPVLFPIMNFLNVGTQYITHDMYKYKLIIFLKNKQPPSYYCKYCKNINHDILDCPKMICSYCNVQGHSIKYCEIKNKN